MFVTAPSGASNRKGNDMDKFAATNPNTEGSRILEIRETALDHACNIFGGRMFNDPKGVDDTVVKAAGKFEAYLRSGV